MRIAGSIRVSASIAAVLVTNLVFTASSHAAGSCSSWKATCESRGGASYCDSQYGVCMRSGCWTEGKQFGGKRHCGLSKK